MTAQTATKTVSDVSRAIPAGLFQSQATIPAMRACLWCGVDISGKRRDAVYCGPRCVTAHRTSRIRERELKYPVPPGSAPRHAYYLELKDRGYYNAVCKCGRRKSLQSRACSFCSPGGMPAQHDKRAKGSALCVCGKPRSQYGKLCRSCAGLKEQERRHRAAQANPHCPNPFPGSLDCSTRQPHAHCKYCSEPIPVDQGMCRDCIRAVERGACMDERESRKYEEAA